MQFSTRNWILAVVLLSGAGVGAYFLTRWLLHPASPQVGPPPVHQAQQRERLPVPAVRFTDITEKAGVRFRHVNGASGRKLLPETMGSGVAFLDYDGDGRQDLLFVNSCPWPGHKEEGDRPTLKLYRNKGNGEFEDVTKSAGLDVTLYGMGACVGDYDNDGRPDLFVSCVGRHRLFRNVDGKRFEDATDAAGVGGPGKMPDCSREEFIAWKPPIPFGSSCTFLDYDGDGRLDLFVCHYVTWSPHIDLTVGSSLRGGGRTFVQPRDFEGGQCALYRNVGGGKFEDVSEAAGVLVFEQEGTDPKARKRPVAKSLGVVLCDADGDGWPDLLVANDTVRNFFFRNVADPQAPGGRKFAEVGFEAGAAYAEGGQPRGGMGIDWGEYRPGKFAAVVANFANEPDTFLRLDSRSPLLFADAAVSVGLAGPSRGPLKFGAFFFDYDLDGRLDLLTCDGHIEPDIASIQGGQHFAQPAQLFWNTGQASPQFEPVTAADAGEDLFRPMVGRGSAFADIDGDGDLDLVLTANGGPPRLLRNDCALGHHWIRLTLSGDGKASNRSAIGAQVTVEAGGKTYRRQVTGGRGYLSQSELPLTIGLGGATKVDRVTVRWPGKDAGTEVWADLPTDRPHELKQGEGKGQ